jgi:hypothetical protein
MVSKVSRVKMRACTVTFANRTQLGQSVSMAVWGRCKDAKRLRDRSHFCVVITDEAEFSVRITTSRLRHPRRPP